MISGAHAGADVKKPVARGRGRPRKTTEPESDADASADKPVKPRITRRKAVEAVPRDKPSEWVVPNAPAAASEVKPSPRAALVKPVDEGTVLHPANDISDDEIRVRREAARAVVADIGRMKNEVQSMNSYIASPTQSSSDSAGSPAEIPEQPLSHNDYWRQRREERYLQRQQRRLSGSGQQNPYLPNPAQQAAPRPQGGGSPENQQGRHVNRRERQRQRQHPRFGGGQPDRMPPPQIPSSQPPPMQQPPIPPLQQPTPFVQQQSLPPLRMPDLQALARAALLSIAEEQGLGEGLSSLAKHDLVSAILRNHANRGGSVIGEGVLELCAEGIGYLRNPWNSYKSCPEDAMVPLQVVRKFALRPGDKVVGPTRPPSRDQRERRFVLTEVSSVNGVDPVEASRIPLFESLVPTYPVRRIRLETVQNEIDMRVMDLFTPMGFGQRALIVAPSRTGKTVLIRKMANAISNNHPDADLVVLLLDERPEEVTEMERCTKARIFASTFDEAPEKHVQVAEVVIELARRKAEQGRDVIILLDSITRLTRAYNVLPPSGGKTVPGTLDTNALQKAKGFFGAARNLEGGGSLTIIATVLVGTGSKIDDMIAEEFRGTCNLELNLDRQLAERGVYPAINIGKSGTRREDLLLDPEESAKTVLLRRDLMELQPLDAMETVVKRMKNVRTNAELLTAVKA